MKKFILMVAIIGLGLGFTSCSDGSSSDSDSTGTYILESGQIPQTLVETAMEQRQNLGQFPSYSEKKELRNYLYQNKTAYEKTTVSETQLRQLLSELNPSVSAINAQMAELKRTTNDVQIIETTWFYAEQK